MSRFAFPFALIAILLAATSFAPNTGNAEASLYSVPRAELVGKGKMTFLGFGLFNAELYAPNGSYDRNAPFALKLTYLRDFKGQDITNQTIQELKRLGQSSPQQLARWKSQLVSIFPNVSKGQAITGIRLKSGVTRFYSNGRKLGEITDTAFGPAFFDIWLGANTKNPSLRARLIGAS